MRISLPKCEIFVNRAVPLFRETDIKMPELITMEIDMPEAITLTTLLIEELRKEMSAEELAKATGLIGER